jgi:hypothetical protein
MRGYQDLRLDVMPLETKTLGFPNRWYADALEGFLFSIPFTVRSLQNIWQEPTAYTG